jgi:beta-lactamase regulating signal transducer with metallopeptidase domain/thiol-disulfide isomerase/thioredoxin
VQNLLAIAAQNTIAAGILAVVVYVLARAWRRPPIAHILWLVVLAKLIGPPVLHIDMTGLLSRRPAIEPRAGGRDLAGEANARGVRAGFASLAEPIAHSAQTGNSIVKDKHKPEAASSAAAGAAILPALRSLWTKGGDFVQRYRGEALVLIFLAWVGGVGLCGAITLGRIIQFNRMIQGTLAAPQCLQTITAELARKLGVRSVPDLRLVDGAISPLVWWVGRRPIIALPSLLISELDGQQTAMVLAHELAHLRRRDHWVRGIEVLISVLYWWNPLVWWVRRQLHGLEELCCDAWVEWAFPDGKRCYAEVLFKAATLAGPTHDHAPSMGSAFLNHGILKARLEAVLEGGMSRQVSPRAALCLAAVAIVMLPSFAPSFRAVDAGSPFESRGERRPADPEPKPALGGKIVGTVTVKGTNEPVRAATVRVMIGRQTNGLSRWNDAISATTDASGHYSIGVPIGHVRIGRFDSPAGYWLEGGAGNQVVTSAEAPVATRDFSVRRGPVLRVRARDRAAGKPIEGIQCFATRVDDGSMMKSWSDTDALGIARSTLPGFHGEFRFDVLSFWEPADKWEIPPQKPSLTIEPGFRIDRVRAITPEEPPETFRITDAVGKVATLRHARATLVQGEFVMEVDLQPTDPEAVGEIRGIVVDEKGRPVTGARVGLVWNSIVTTGVTASDGRFALRDHWIRTVDQPGIKLSVAAIKDGYGGVETRPVKRPDDARAPIDFGRIVLLPGKSIRVRVLGKDGKPAVGAWVEPQRTYAASSQIAMTDQWGECVIRNLPAGATELYLSYGDSYANITAYADDGTDPLTIRLKPIPQQDPLPAPPNTPAVQHVRSTNELGKPAPPFAVKEWTDGKTRSLADYQGKVVVLNFWGIWSGPCGYAMPVIKKLAARFKGRDVVFLGIHTAGTDVEDVRAFLQHIKLNLLTAIDAGEDETSKQYGVNGYPTLVVIGREGLIDWNSRQVSKEDGTKRMERAAKALSIPWPLDEKQPQEKLIEQGWQIQEFFFGEAIDRALASS